jgi:hypothetical protein
MSENPYQAPTQIVFPEPRTQAEIAAQRLALTVLLGFLVAFMLIVALASLFAWLSIPNPTPPASGPVEPPKPFGPEEPVWETEEPGPRKPHLRPSRDYDPVEISRSRRANDRVPG